MSVSLSYVPEAKVSPEITELLFRSAQAIQFNWWAEGVHFFDDPRVPGTVAGDTKLFLLGDETTGGNYREVDPDDDSLMAWRDATFIIETLERWGRESRIGWVLSCEGEDAGKITSSGRDAVTEEFLSSLKSSVLEAVTPRESPRSTARALIDGSERAHLTSGCSGLRAAVCYSILHVLAAARSR
jgi:hypothetical protein